MGSALHLWAVSKSLMVDSQPIGEFAEKIVQSKALQRFSGPAAKTFSHLRGFLQRSTDRGKGPSNHLLKRESHVYIQRKAR